MTDQIPQPTSEQVVQRLRLMDMRLDQRYPGYLAALELLRQPRNHEKGEWTPLTEQWHRWKGQEH